MNKSLKSIAYAFISKDIEVYLPDDEEDCILINKLVCANCGEHWHTSLNECYFCGEINYYTYKCSVCGKEYSITNSATKCNCGSKDAKLTRVCMNDLCISNTDEEISRVVSEDGGVFSIDSSFSISQTYCVNCGDIKNYYKSYRVYVFDEKQNESIHDFISKHSNLSQGDIIIGKKHFGDILRYGLVIYNTENITDIKYEYDSVNQIVNVLFPVIKVDI